MNVEFMFIICTSILCWLVSYTDALGDIIVAVNCGGDSHTDVHGVRYQRDLLTTGIPSDYGKNLLIQRVLPQDQILYQTERYHTATLGYDIPIKDDGDYVLVMKFSEVWFTASGQKIFDIVFNGDHTIVEGLDIYARVGRGVAHDEVVPFSVKNGVLKVGTETSKIVSNKVSLEFLKGEHDNPKINAFYVVKGSPEGNLHIPQLPPLQGADDHVNESERDQDDDENEERDSSASKQDKKRRLSGPPVADPYATDDTSSMLLPVVVAVGAFIPLVFCLCKL